MVAYWVVPSITFFTSFYFDKDRVFMEILVFLKFRDADILIQLMKIIFSVQFRGFCSSRLKLSSKPRWFSRFELGTPLMGFSLDG